MNYQAARHLSTQGHHRQPVYWHGIAVYQIVGAAESDDRLTMLTYELPPHTTAPPMHCHTRTLEVLFLLEGLLAVTVNEETVILTPGASLTLQPGVTHTFFNPSASRTLCLALYQPGGQDIYFAALARTGEEMGDTSALLHTLDQLHDIHLAE